MMLDASLVMVIGHVCILHSSLYPVLSWAPPSVLLSVEDDVRSGMSDLQLARPLAMKVSREATLAIRQQENMNRENW